VEFTFNDTSVQHNSDLISDLLCDDL